MQDKNSTWIKQIDKKKITNIKTGNKISRFEHGLQWQWNMQSDQWYNIIQKVNKGIMVWDKITKLNLKVENSKTEDENGQKEVQQRHTLNSEAKKEKLRIDEHHPTGISRVGVVSVNILLDESLVGFA